MEWSDEELKKWKENIDNGICINPKTDRKIKSTGQIYKNLEKEFKKRLSLNIIKDEINENKSNKIDIKEEIQYPFTIPIMCFTCNTVISRIDIFNRLWDIYNNNINNNLELINRMLYEEEIDKNKWLKEIKKNWWQKIGGFEKIRDGIEIDFIIDETEWKNIGIENLCCKRMIYTHQEHPLFVNGPSDY